MAVLIDEARALKNLYFVADGVHSNASYLPGFLLRLSTYRGVTPFGPPMWQAEADTKLRLSVSPTQQWVKRR